MFLVSFVLVLDLSGNASATADFNGDKVVNFLDYAELSAGNRHANGTHLDTQFGPTLST